MRWRPGRDVWARPMRGGNGWWRGRRPNGARGSGLHGGAIVQGSVDGGVELGGFDGFAEVLLDVE